MTKTLHGRLEAHRSRRDINGNTYWALRYVDYATGCEVVGTISGGEGNINAIRMGFSAPGEWDRGIECITVEHGIRDFNRLTKDWPYLGCDPDELRAAIKSKIAEDD
jgi:hypothetical protein